MVLKAVSGRFRRISAYGAGTGGRSGKVPESSGVKWYRFRRQVPGRFRCMLASVPEVVGSGRFRKVGSGRSWKVPEGSESSGTCWYGFRRQVRTFRRVAKSSARVAVGSGGRVLVRRVPVWFVALQP